jgi:hypothetical protein
MKTSIAAAAFAAAGLCLLATACSSANPQSPPAAAAAAQSSSSSSSSSSSGSAGAGAATCQQITLAQVQPLIVQTVVNVTATAITADGQGQQCEFDAKNSDSTGSVTVQVLAGTHGTTAYAQAVAGEANPVAVSGVGDKASRDTEDGRVNALKGDTFCSVSYSSSDDIPGVGPLEEAHGATNNIGENYYNTIAQAMGTLCNRIYGSGNTTPDLSSLLAVDATATASDDGGLPATAALPSDSPTG